MLESTEYRRDGFEISTDPNRLDLEVIHSFLSRSSYWAQGRPYSVVQKSVQNSLCFGLYQGPQQVGFARVVTDYATFAWLCDVFILEAHRGRGLGKWLIECVVTYPELSELRLFLLATRDAHELYRRFGGFDVVKSRQRWMIRSNAG
jgi:GNAT superfamily N-acetyltransferase